MISELYTLIGQAFETKNYNQVIDLIEQALTIPEFGFNMNLLYKYGYSLLKAYRIKEGLHILKIVAEKDTKESMIEIVNEIIKKWEEHQALKIPIKKYLKKGCVLQPGLVVHLKENCEITRENVGQEINFRSSYMIWKIEDNKVYAFPLKKYKNHGYCLLDFKYLNACHLTAIPALVSFDVKDILRLNFILDPIDFNCTIRDLYERYCIFGTIRCTPKNYFVTENEQYLSPAIGDIITLYDPTSRFRIYYFITGIDYDQGVYKGYRISHKDGDVSLKDNLAVEVPLNSYIMEKISISPENHQKLQAAILSIEESNIKR